MEQHQTDSGPLLITIKKKRKGSSKMLWGKSPEGKARLPFHQIQKERGTTWEFCVQGTNETDCKGRSLEICSRFE